MNAGSGGAVSICMPNKPNSPPKEKDSLTPKEQEIQSLFARGKSPETIAIRLGMKISKVLGVIALVPKPLG
jgi:DNA-binding NarL/FixJ family response regulator